MPGAERESVSKRERPEQAVNMAQASVGIKPVRGSDELSEGIIQVRPVRLGQSLGRIEA